MVKLLRKLDPEIHTGLRAPQDLVRERSEGSPRSCQRGYEIEPRALMGRVQVLLALRRFRLRSDDLVGRAVLTELVDLESVRRSDSWKKISDLTAPQSLEASLSEVACGKF